MRKISVLIVFLMAVSQMTDAQKLQFTPMAGYTFADKFSFHKGTARIGDGFTWSGILTAGISQNLAVELSYSRQECDVYALSEYHGIDIDGRMTANYIFMGGSKLYPVNDATTLFTGANLGAGIYSGKTSNIESSIKFAVGFNGGVKFLLSEKFGLRLQANLKMPVTDVNAGLWWSSGSGTSVGLSSRVPFLQFGFMGGLIFNLKK